MTSKLYTPTAQEIETAAAAAMTGEAGRIQRAADLVAAGAVHYISQELGWAVMSQRNKRQQDPEDLEDLEDLEPKFYTVCNSGCSCYDYLNRGAPCKHVLAVQLLMRVLAVKFNELVSNGGAYLVELSGSDYGLYDSETDEPICAAVYVSRSDTYRPTDSAAAAAFAAWLSAQPVAVAASEYFPGGLLEKILRGAPDKVTLKADVIYGDTRTYTLAGYRYDGGTWVRLEQEQRQQFNETAWNNLLSECGFIMTARPAKQPGLAYNYFLERGANDEKHYGLSAQAAEYLERNAVRRMFENDLAPEKTLFVEKKMNLEENGDALWA